MDVVKKQRQQTCLIDITEPPPILSKDNESHGL